MAKELYRSPPGSDLDNKRQTREDGNRERTRESRVHVTSPRLGMESRR